MYIQCMFSLNRNNILRCLFHGQKQKGIQSSEIKAEKLKSIDQLDSRRGQNLKM